ncbi:hypothetical protein AMTR_s00036p00074990, partial [Amborella trichopoda]
MVLLYNPEFGWTYVSVDMLVVHLKLPIFGLDENSYFLFSLLRDGVLWWMNAYLGNEMAPMFYFTHKCMVTQDSTEPEFDAASSIFFEISPFNPPGCQLGWRNYDCSLANTNAYALDSSRMPL